MSEHVWTPVPGASVAPMFRCGSCGTSRFDAIDAAAPPVFARSKGFSGRLWFETDPGCGPVPRVEGVTGEAFVANDWTFPKRADVTPPVSP